MLTNTPIVRRSFRRRRIQWRLPTVTEPSGSWGLCCRRRNWLGWLERVNGFHVTPEHAFHSSNPGIRPRRQRQMVGVGPDDLQRFKGGIGHSSRKLSEKDGCYTSASLGRATSGSRRIFASPESPVWPRNFPPISLTPTSPPNLRRGSIDYCRRHRPPLISTHSSDSAHPGHSRSSAASAAAPRRPANFIASPPPTPDASMCNELADLKMLPNGALDPSRRRRSSQITDSCHRHLP